MFERFHTIALHYAAHVFRDGDERTLHNLPEHTYWTSAHTSRTHTHTHLASATTPNNKHTKKIKANDGPDLECIGSRMRTTHQLTECGDRIYLCMVAAIHAHTRFIYTHTHTNTRSCSHTHTDETDESRTRGACTGIHTHGLRSVCSRSTLSTGCQQHPRVANSKRATATHRTTTTQSRRLGGGGGGALAHRAHPRSRCTR